MAVPVKLDLTIYQGDTFERIIRWESEPKVWKPISAITVGAPCRLTVSSHGITNGWRFAILSCKGLTQLNAKTNTPKDSEYYRALVVDSNTIELNDVNSSDYSAYTGSGYIVYNTPVDLAGYTAKMEVRDKIGGTVITTLTTANGGITIDNTEKTITLFISSTDTSNISVLKGIYDLEMSTSGGKVTKLISGKIKVEEQVTLI